MAMNKVDKKEKKTKGWKKLSDDKIGDDGA